MRRSSSQAVLAVLMVLGLGATVARADEVPDLVQQVSQPNFTSYLVNLYASSGDSRGANAPQHDAARGNIRDHFAQLGLTTTLHPFQWQGGTYYNVVGVLEGKTRPTEYHVIGAHYDSVNNAGADDDASGVAGVMEIARILSKHQFQTSIVFIAFDREEAGLVGSQYWAAEHSRDQILSMVALDMIGFNPPGGTHDAIYLLTGNTAPNPTLAALSNAVWQYSGGLTPISAGVSTRSDHYSFAPYTPSVMMLEASFNQNYYYHRSGDSVSTPNYIDYRYGTMVTRSTVGYLATQAGLMDELGAEPDTPMLTSSGIANSASWVVGPAAPSALVSLGGVGLTDGNGASKVSVRDAEGNDQSAAVIYEAPSQINVVMPEGLAGGAGTITVTRADDVSLSAEVRIQAVTPGLFAADATGSGAAAAQAVRVAPDDSQTLRDLFACEPGAPPVCASVPVDWGSTDDRAFLILYATGVRGRSGLSAVRVEVGGTKLQPVYAGAQPVFPGLDQINVELPRSMRGWGRVPVILWVDGKGSNPVTVDLGQ